MGTVHKKRFFSSETRCSLSPSLYHYLHYHLQPESHDDRLCESLLSNCEVAPAFWLSFDNAAQPPPSNACNHTLDTTIITRILRSSNIRRIEFWVSPSRFSRVFKVLQCVNHKSKQDRKHNLFCLMTSEIEAKLSCFIIIFHWNKCSLVKYVVLAWIFSFFR